MENETVETSFNPFDDKYNIPPAGQEERLLGILDSMQTSLQLYVQETQKKEERLTAHIEETQNAVNNVLKDISQVVSGVAGLKVQELRSELVKKGVLEDE